MRGCSLKMVGANSWGEYRITSLLSLFEGLASMEYESERERTLGAPLISFPFFLRRHATHPSFIRFLNLRFRPSVSTDRLTIGIYTYFSDTDIYLFNRIRCYIRNCPHD
jgi:hypothetical protein